MEGFINVMTIIIVPIFIVLAIILISTRKSRPGVVGCSIGAIFLGAAVVTNAAAVATVVCYLLVIAIVLLIIVAIFA